MLNEDAVKTIQDTEQLATLDFVKAFVAAKQQAENCVVIIEELLTQDCDEANVDLAPEDSGHIFHIGDATLQPEQEVSYEEHKQIPDDKPEEVYNNPVLLLNLTKIENLSLKNPEQIEFIDENLVGLVDWALPYVCILDEQGEVVAKYYGREKGQPLKGFQMCRNSMHIVQSNAITKINLGFPTQEPVLATNTNIPKMSKIAFLEKDKGIVASFRGNCLYEYNAQDGKWNVLVEDLNGPSHVNIFEDPTGIKYLVTLRNGQYISVFDENWNYLYKIGKGGKEDGELQYPGATVVTPSGVVLVTDWGNNRICMFAMEGTFLGHLMTEKDGIQSPIGIALKYPKMWITEHSTGANHAAIKCFQFE